jgi:hypothetical protein
MVSRIAFPHITGLPMLDDYVKCMTFRIRALRVFPFFWCKLSFELLRPDPACSYETPVWIESEYTLVRSYILC